MIIQYLRSSSWSNFDFCQMQYYINYVLGIPRSSSIKANKGTATHKVLEVLANCKKVIQNTEPPPIDIGTNKQLTDGVYFYIDKELGEINWTEKDFLLPYTMTDDEVNTINKTRINKSTYKHECKLPYGHTRYGVDLVEELIKRSCDYYAEGWAPVDYRDVNNFVWMELDHNDGMFDPRKRTIIAAEPHFDYIIDKDWAKFEWDIPNSKKISGKLGIKGTIDLITEASPGIIEIIDFKSGQRIDWTSKHENKIKSYADLCKDFQLMLYYYAAKRMYPQAKQIIVTIFFIRDGGPFTICFDEDVIQQTEDKLRSRFEEIKACTRPTMQDPTQKNFKCIYICDYFKMPSPCGQTNLCRHIHDRIHEVGIDQVTQEYTTEGFSVGEYQAPGEKNET